jgi:hypothetical protein
LKEEALDRIKWRNRFGRGCGPVVCQITDEWIRLKEDRLRTLFCCMYIFLLKKHYMFRLLIPLSIIRCFI